MRGGVRDWVRVSLTSAALAVGLVAALAAGGVEAAQQAVHPRASKPAEDVRVHASDFRNLNTMTKVRGFFVDNLRGHLRRALQVARSKKGGVYPVGTVLQLVPQEAMVKRRAGFSRATHDWEFFVLDVSAQGTRITTRGTGKVVNRFGGSCAGCHSSAEGKFDMVCEHDHGCAPLPVGDDIIAAIQRADPRPVTQPAR